jgi:hypothetical protein
MITFLTQLLIVLSLSLTPEVQIRAVSHFFDVDPLVAIAISNAETGAYSEEIRDSLISPTDDWGRFQINCRFWKNHFGLPSCEPFLNQHFNILSGIYILSRFQDKFKPKKLTRHKKCKCKKKKVHHWAIHYNSGGKVTKFALEIYQKRFDNHYFVAQRNSKKEPNFLLTLRKFREIINSGVEK